MSLQGDKAGIVTIPEAIASGDFSIIFSSVTLTNTGSYEMIMGRASANTDFIAITSGSRVEARIASNTMSPSYAGSLGEVVKIKVYRQNGDGIVRMSINDAPDVAIENNSSVFNLGTIFAYSGGALKGGMLLGGTIEMVGFDNPTSAGEPENRSYDLEGTGSTLVDTVSGQDGALSGFTTGGFTAPVVPDETTISITSLEDDAVSKRDENGQAVFTVAGVISGTVTSVEYSVGGGAWAVLDASPEATTYTGQVTVTNEQDISVRVSNDTETTATVLRVKASLNIAAWGQSNEAGRGLNSQPFVLGAGKPKPMMYRYGVLSPLADPTGQDGSQAGSVWARIAQLYSDAGIPVCIGNVAQGGTTLAQWNTVGTRYNKIVQFANAVGGISFSTCTIGESDQGAGTSQASIEASLEQVVNAIASNYGAKTYVTYYPGGNGLGGDGANVYAAFDSVVALNANAEFGGDLRFIDIDTGVSAGNDGLHLKSDADLVTAADIRYAAFTGQAQGITSTFNLMDTEAPNGTYMTKFYDDVLDVLIEEKNLTFLDGNASADLAVPIGNAVHSLYKGDNAPQTGICYVGVTE